MSERSGKTAEVTIGLWFDEEAATSTCGFPITGC